MCIIHLHRINFTDFESTGRLTSVIVSENSQKKTTCGRLMNFEVWTFSTTFYV